MTPLLTVRNVTKTYPGVRALDSVSFDLEQGEVHCLVGENGAGKSTFIKILAGAIDADEGEILIDGSRVEVTSPIISQALGIGVIYQELKIVPELSVAENILLGAEPTAGPLGLLDSERMHTRAKELLDLLGEPIDTRARARDLSTAHQQIVEIAKALSRNVRILIMDEPTAPLTEHEIAGLFAVVRKLKAESVGIIYISHRLEEIFEIGDRVTVLRDGKIVTTSRVSDVDRRSLIRSMVGRELEQEFPPIDLKGGDELFSVSDLSGGPVRDVSFSVRRGEIFGIAGLVGSGRSELARLIFGADPKEGGTMVLEGKQYEPASPRDAIDAGIGLLTEDRNRYGLILGMNIRENISLANLSSLVKRGFISHDADRNVAREFSEQLSINPSDPEVNVQNLSGGNRQKVVLARWLYTQSKILIFDEPTAGVDVGVKYEIYTLMGNLARRGVGVIMISSDLVELMGISTRIAVMCEGRMRGILPRGEATKETILSLATDFTGDHAGIA